MQIIRWCVIGTFVCTWPSFASAETPGPPTGAGTATTEPAAADPATYLAEFSRLANVDWPKNRTLRVVAHGHSVPAGYFKTPEVRTFDAYPALLHHALCEKYSHAVINVITTAIGGENAKQGAARFEEDVLSLKPDVVLIDYSLNDRPLGLEVARAAWVSMIEKCKAKGIPVILLTPTPDTRSKPADPTDPLNQHAEQVRSLARLYHVGLVDSLSAFRAKMGEGVELSTLMSQINHPNRAGHELVAKEIAKWFN